jgi:galactose mutarotase-like enzyme
VKTEIEHSIWGEWPSIRLVTPAVELEVVGEVGARIVSLRDRRSKREWLAQGEPPTELQQMEWAREDVGFGGRESFGWDECLPTTSVCPDPLAPDGPALRDHGDQWGRGAYLSLDAEEGAVVHTWSGPRWGYRLSRRLSFQDEQTLLVEYLVSSITAESLPIHWAQHPVLRLEPGSYLDLPGVHEVRRSWQQGIDLPDEMSWPTATATDGREVNLACVRKGEGWASVLYAEPQEEIRAVTPDGARLDMDWDREFAPAVRIWLAYGGWPPGGPPAEQVALEPCTSMHDDLNAALEAGQARILEPGAELRWWVRLRLSK